MLESILGIVAGFFDFTSYVTDYFRDQRIRDTQRHIDNLNSELSALRSTVKQERNANADKIAALHMHYAEEIEQIVEDAEATVNPKVGGREISG